MCLATVSLRARTREIFVRSSLPSELGEGNSAGRWESEITTGKRRDMVIYFLGDERNIVFLSGGIFFFVSSMVFFSAKEDAR